MTVMCSYWVCVYGCFAKTNILRVVPNKLKKNIVFSRDSLAILENREKSINQLKLHYCQTFSLHQLSNVPIGTLQMSNLSAHAKPANVTKKKCISREVENEAQNGKNSQHTVKGITTVVM